MPSSSRPHPRRWRWWRPDIDKLSNIIRASNNMFGNIEWKDGDKIRKVITKEIPARVVQDKAYQNAQANSDKQNAKLEHDKALNRVVLGSFDHTELFKQYSDNHNFKRWMTDMVFYSTYHPARRPLRCHHRQVRRREVPDGKVRGEQKRSSKHCLVTPSFYRIWLNQRSEKWFYRLLGSISSADFGVPR
ncbi:hypothetical protein [Nitrosovibrio sp. Nv4]|uniref:hypothetical protein n=1 Tax=Nitrosovibrio sp. Nv4 TaxID=1945880 RepID=UPI00190EEC46|nr:hypothetical protein [Nitrosovibrio sp. Nv4]